MSRKGEFGANALENIIHGEDLPALTDNQLTEVQDALRDASIQLFDVSTLLEFSFVGNINESALHAYLEHEGRVLQRLALKFTREAWKRHGLDLSGNPLKAEQKPESAGVTAMKADGKKKS